MSDQGGDSDPESSDGKRTLGWQSKTVIIIPRLTYEFFEYGVVEIDGTIFVEVVVVSRLRRRLGENSSQLSL